VEGVVLDEGGGKPVGLELRTFVGLHEEATAILQSIDFDENHLWNRKGIYNKTV
jgi:hypothetical protein